MLRVPGNATRAAVGMKNQSDGSSLVKRNVKTYGTRGEAARQSRAYALKRDLPEENIFPEM